MDDKKKNEEKCKQTKYRYSKWLWLLGAMFQNKVHGGTQTHMHAHTCIYIYRHKFYTTGLENPKYHRVKPSFGFYLVSFPDSNIWNINL